MPWVGSALLELVEPEAVALQVLGVLRLDGVQLAVRRTGTTDNKARQPSSPSAATPGAHPARLEVGLRG